MSGAPVPCDVCGADVVEPAGLWVAVSYTDADGDDLDADVAFCSREHAAQWFAAQEPPGEAALRARGSAPRHRQGPRATAGGYVAWALMTLAVIVVVGLVGIGAATVIRSLGS